MLYLFFYIFFNFVILYQIELQMFLLTNYLMHNLIITIYNFNFFYDYTLLLLPTLNTKPGISTFIPFLYSTNNYKTNAPQQI